MAARSRALCAFEEHAHNRPGIERSARRTGEFLRCMAARSRALCASEDLAILEERDSDDEKQFVSVEEARERFREWLLRSSTKRAR